MQKFPIPIILLLAALILSCNNESIETEAMLQFNDPNFRVNAGTVKYNFASRASYDEPCKTTNLIAGQHHIAGTVSVDIVDENIRNPAIAGTKRQRFWKAPH